MRVTIVLAKGVEEDVVIRDGTSPVVGDIRKALTQLLVGDRATDTLIQPLYLGDRQVPDKLTLGQSGIREGSRLGLGHPLVPTEPELVPGMLLLCTVSGPGAGRVQPLPTGSFTFSINAHGDARVPGEPAADLVLVEVDSDGGATLTPSSGIAVTIEGEGVHNGRVWTIGDQLSLADILLELRRVPAPYRALTAAVGAVVEFIPPPRVPIQAPSVSFTMPRPPLWEEPRSLSLWPLLATLVLAAVIALALRRAAFLVLALGGPLAALVSYGSARVADRRRRTDALTQYREALGRTTRDLSEAVRREVERLRHAAPDPAEIVVDAVLTRHRLWERRAGDDDFLVLRIGTHLTVVNGELQAGALEARLNLPLVRDLPAVVRLGGCGVLGVAGSPTHCAPVVRWLLMQSAALHSPRDLKLCILSEDMSRWQSLVWLPHLLADDDEGASLRIGIDGPSMATRVRELRDLIAHRSVTPADKDPQERPDVLLLLDDIEHLARIPDVRNILRSGPSVGVRAICVGNDPVELVGLCPALITVDGAVFEFTHKPSATLLRGRADLVGETTIEEVSRSLAPLRDASREPSSRPPSSCRLLDLLKLDTVSSSAVRERWDHSGSTSVTIGDTGAGPFSVDLRSDGPHLLVVGSTGSGKSELLRTVVASLALSSRPDDVSFLLLDYKGGFAFGDCSRLPHTVGLITDLGGREGERILASLGAELGRRERLLRNAGVTQIDDIDGIAATRPPRLIVIVDELAIIAAEQPDFLRGLGAIARTGRSLGINLVLSTQSARSVPAYVRADTNLVIALRVIDQSDSIDVIGAPDAAHISRSRPGRAVARLGPVVLVPFQTGFVGGAGPRNQPAAVSRATWERLADARTWSSASAWADGSTDLELIVDAVRGAATELALAPPRRPVLPSLASLYRLQDLPIPPPTADLAPVIFGVEDQPSSQAQPAAKFDLASQGHLLVVGAPRSGRSQLLRTFACAVAMQHSASDVHLFVVDSGNREMESLIHLPHCGAVVAGTDVRRIKRLTDRLATEIRRRQEILADGYFANATAQRSVVPSEQRLAHIVVLIDGWERARDRHQAGDTSALVSRLPSLLREGRSTGIHFVLTTDSPRRDLPITQEFESTIALRLSGRDEFALGMRRRLLPTELPPGRGFWAGTGTELQVALGDVEEVVNGAQQRAGLIPVSRLPFRIEELTDISDRFHVGDSHGHPIGREDVIAWLRDRHATGASAVLLGPRRAGKTWVLTELERRLYSEGARSVMRVVIPLPSAGKRSREDLALILGAGRLQKPSPPSGALLTATTDSGSGIERPVYLLDEVGRLVGYEAAAVSWLRDLGQAGAWLVYTGTEKDWHEVVRWALTSPGSSFGNDVNARVLGPLDERTAVTFLSGTAANLGVTLNRTRARAVVELVDTWPFYLQVVGDAIVRSVQSGDVAPINDDEALRDLVDRRLLDEWTQSFQARWVEIGEAGRAALLERGNASPPSLTPGQRNDLRDVGLLRPGDTWLPDRPFFRWVHRNRSLLADRNETTQ